MSGPGPSGGYQGLTLIELLTVLSVIALTTALALPALRDGTASGLREEALRLAHLLEQARAASRARDETVTWQVQGPGFVFRGPVQEPRTSWWLHPDTEAEVLDAQTLELGPEPVIAAQTVRLRQRQRPELSWWVYTDGARPFEALDSPPPTVPGIRP